MGNVLDSMVEELAATGRTESFRNHSRDVAVLEELELVIELEAVNDSRGVPDLVLEGCKVVRRMYVTRRGCVRTKNIRGVFASGRSTGTMSVKLGKCESLTTSARKW